MVAFICRLSSFCFHIFLPHCFIELSSFALSKPIFFIPGSPVNDRDFLLLKFLFNFPPPLIKTELILDQKIERHFENEIKNLMKVILCSDTVEAA